MIRLSKILSPDLTLCKLGMVQNKKQALEEISRLVYEVDHAIKYQETLEVLQQRERLGSTALGHGIAVPHGRIPHLDNPICVLMTLEKAIEFDASNNESVDIIFGLLVPEKANDTHLEILSALVSKLKTATYRDKLRLATTNEALYQAALENSEA